MRSVRCRWVFLWLLLAATGVSLAQEPSVRTCTLNISARSLGDALAEFGQQADLTVVFYDTDLKQGQTSKRLVGTMTAQHALEALLANTGLRFQYLDAKTIAVLPQHDIPQNNPLPLSSANGGTEDKDSSVLGAKANESLWDRFLVAQSAQSPDTTSVNGESQNSPDESEKEVPLQEVLVTAQKNGVAERLQDVPVPIAVISAQALTQNNQAEIQDYFDQIPGLSIAEGGSGLSIVSIRGITTGQNTNPTVGYTLDDVPLGASTNGGGVGQVPFINPVDIAQVEVLRGPQGTLYGDNSMGGLIRYVTVDPATDRIFGDVRVGGDGVVNGTHLGYNTSAAVNVPLTDTLAIRASAFTRLDPGYIDNVETGERGEGLTKAGGGRLAGMWTPSSDFSLKFSALYEKTDRYGSNDVVVPTADFPQTAGLGDLQQYYLRDTGDYTQEFKNASLTLNANLGGVKLTAISGYTVNGFIMSLDYSWAFAPPPSSYASPFLEDNELHKFTQEIRLTDTIGSHIEWLLGGFYTQEDNTYIEYASTADPTSGDIITPYGLFYSGGPNRYTEYAGFGALTWKVTDRFDVQFGGRESYMSTPSEPSYSGGSIYGETPGPSVYSPPSIEYWKANAFTYLVSPRFRISPDIMVYARVADGFRPGYGTSDPQPTDTCVVQHQQCQINSDKITNYEVGLKADFFDHILSIDSSVYYIDWKDLQVELTGADHLNYSGNGAGAKSQGVDLSLQWKPFESLTISSWGAWNQAVVTQTFSNATSGQPLPYSARFSANFSVEKDVFITHGVHAFFAGKEIYMGDRLGDFTAVFSPRQDLPAYSQTDVNAGIKADPWTLNLYMNNATDRRGVLYGGISATAPFAFDYIRPRTIGLSIGRTF